MSRWTVSGKLSPLITPEDLALEETARAPARSCYHLQQEGLSHPLLTPCLWQCLLVFIWVLRVCQGGEKKKKVSLQEISPLTAKEALSLHWQWTALCFLWVLFWLAPAGLGCSHWVQDRGSLWAVSFSQNHQLPRLSFKDCTVYFYWIFPLVGSQRTVTTNMQRLQVPSHLQPAWHMVNRRGMRAREHNFDVQDCESVPRCFWISLWRQASRCLSYPAL